MRIRKRSISLLSHPSWEKKGKGGSFCIGDGSNHEEEEAEKEEFLFPLLAAAMDVEAKAESKLARDSTSKPSPPEISEIGVHKRKWRNALVGFEADSHAVKVSVGGDKATCIRYGTRSINRGDKLQRPKIEACAMEGRSSSVEQEISGLDSKLVLPISGGCEKSLMSREREYDLGVDTLNKKRSNPNGANGDTKCNVMEHINARRKRPTKIWGDKGIARNNRQESKGKASNIDNNKNKKNDDDDNGGSGSRCKRRNGRGWQCSQRTLVGYSLCEHHLGKARFTSINARDDRVAVNKKGSKFKDLHLVHAASPKVELA